MITEYNKHYKKEVQKLLKKYPYYIRWNDTAGCRLVAIKDNKVVGIGSSWSNKIHPHREYLGIYVTFDFRRRGIATELYKQLASVSPTRNFQGTVQSQDASAVSFLEKCSFYLDCIGKYKILIYRKRSPGQIVDESTQVSKKNLPTWPDSR